MLALGVWTTAARADHGADRARELFEAAGAMERDARWSDAEVRLRAALRLRETPQLHFALGWALENDDKLLEAKSSYATALGLARRSAQGPKAAARDGARLGEVVRLASTRIAELDAMTPSIRVRVVGPRELRVRIVLDGHEVKRLPASSGDVTALVNPGSHVLRVERGGERGGEKGTYERMVYLGRGTERTIDVDTSVAALDMAQDRPDHRARLPPPGGTLVPLLVLAAGVVCLAGGGALAIATDERDLTSGAGAAHATGIGIAGAGAVATTVGALLLSRIAFSF